MVFSKIKTHYLYKDFCNFRIHSGIKNLFRFMESLHIYGFLLNLGSHYGVSFTSLLRHVCFSGVLPGNGTFYYVGILEDTDALRTIGFLQVLDTLRGTGFLLH